MSLRRRSHAFLIVGLAIALAGCTAQTTSGSSSSPRTQQPAKTSGKTTAGLGEAVRDGNFEFVVKKVSCGKEHLGTADFGTDAQGQFCLVTMTVRNIKKDSQTFFGTNQHLFDSAGRKFDADDEAAVYYDPASKSLLEDINPGNAIDVVVVFDIPKSAKPSKIELHDSAFSDGVTVRLA